MTIAPRCLLSTRRLAERLAAENPGTTPSRIVAGDNHRGKAKDVGRKAAIGTARILGCPALIPTVPAACLRTNFNGMAASGLDAVPATFETDA